MLEFSGWMDFFPLSVLEQKEYSVFTIASPGVGQRFE